jgi:hypothetical protein
MKKERDMDTAFGTSVQRSNNEKTADELYLERRRERAAGINQPTTDRERAELIQRNKDLHQARMKILAKGRKAGVVCPECRTVFGRSNISGHRRLRHGVQGKVGHHADYEQVFFAPKHEAIPLEPEARRTICLGCYARIYRRRDRDHWSHRRSDTNPIHAGGQQQA